MILDIYIEKKLALDIRQEFINKRIINIDTTYIEFVNNTRLMKWIKSRLELGLSDNKDNSNFGYKIVSDFDIAVNYNTTKKMLNFCSNNRLNGEETYELLKAVNRVSRYVTQKRKTLINLMELPGEKDYFDQIAETKKQKANSAADGDSLSKKSRLSHF